MKVLPATGELGRAGSILQTSPGSETFAFGKAAGRARAGPGAGTLAGHFASNGE